MRLNTLHLAGFRNFKDCEITFSEKTLIIGPNDVGKTNLLYALRLLLDSSLSESDIAPTETDFYAYEDTAEFSITAHFVDIQPIIDDCVISYFKGNVEDGQLFLRYHAKKTAEEIEHFILCGKDLNSLSDLSVRSYLKRLALEYLSSYRDLRNYIKREQKYIIEDSKKNRTAEQETEDGAAQIELEASLVGITEGVRKLHFIKTATENFNEELKKLSAKNKHRSILFDAGAADYEQFISNLTLVSHKHGKALALGGDGRNNQIFLSIWSGRKKATDTKKCIYAIEEPEAHLHPHYQRSLSNYLVSKAGNQLIITTHSPQIAAEFNPTNIIRLYESNSQTLAANCGGALHDAALDFAHRMNILPAETFFSDAVFLVEGVSEVLFFKALSKALNKDLDSYNISVLSVEGVGFSPYIELLQELKIPFCLRTDNDVDKMRSGKYRNAGIKRLVEAITKKKSLTEDQLKKLRKEFRDIHIQSDEAQSGSAAQYLQTNRPTFEASGLFLSNEDLEKDLIKSPLRSIILAYSRTDKEERILKEMQKSKGTWMFHFTKQKGQDLAILTNSELVKPIDYCIALVADAANT